MSHPEDRISVTLLDRYLAGVADADERARVEAWVARDPSRRLNAVVWAVPSARARTALKRVLADGSADSTVRRGLRKLAGRHTARIDTATRRATVTWNLRQLRWVALVTVASVTAIVWGHAVGTAWWHVGASHHAPVTYTTTAGQRAVLNLADGSRVMLAPQTTLHLEPGFGTSARGVTLVGEAYFDVAPAARVPFVVGAGGVTTRVLGTAFTVRHYLDERRTRVVVIDGRVAVHARTGQETVLAARMRAEIPDSGLAVFVPDTDVSRYTDWTRGQLVFRGTPLREAFPELARRYGIVIRVADSGLSDQRLTATVTDDPMTTVLDGIAMMFSARYVRDGNTVTFFPARRQAVPARRNQPFSPRSEASYGK